MRKNYFWVAFIAVSGALLLIGSLALGVGVADTNENKPTSLSLNSPVKFPIDI